MSTLTPYRRNAEKIARVNGTGLREKIRGLLGYQAEELGNAQSTGYVLKRLQLTDHSRRKHHVSGKLHAIERREVLDMMRRYDVSALKMKMQKTGQVGQPFSFS
jgi:hypothetical protein